MDTTRPSLLLRIREGTDSLAWQEFDAIYRPMLYRFARARGLDHGDAEDITQQCLTAVADHIGEFAYDPTRGRFKGWLRTMVNRRVSNLMRGRRTDQAGTRDFQRPQQREESPEDVFERLWMQEHLWHCLRSIQHEIEGTTYEAFKQYVIEQLPAAQVCAELGLTDKNLYTIKWRVTDKIATRMKELLGEPEDRAADSP